MKIYEEENGFPHRSADQRSPPNVQINSKRVIARPVRKLAVAIRLFEEYGFPHSDLGHWFGMTELLLLLHIKIPGIAPGDRLYGSLVFRVSAG